METDINSSLDSCRDIGDFFELVKSIARRYIGRDQAGLTVGLSDLGRFPQGFIGAYYSPASNMIIINKRILDKVRTTTPSLYKPYLFHILLHEYVHSLGFHDELQTRKIVYTIAMALRDETIIQLATDMAGYFPHLVQTHEYEMPDSHEVEFVAGIDKKNTNYIN